MPPAGSAANLQQSIGIARLRDCRAGKPARARATRLVRAPNLDEALLCLCIPALIWESFFTQEPERRKGLLTRAVVFLAPLEPQVIGLGPHLPLHR